MKKTSDKSIMEKLLNKEAIHSTSIFVQFIILFVLLVIAICSIFVTEFSASVKAMLGLTFFSMAYNNYKIFKRKGFTLLYCISGLFFLIVAILEIYGL